LNSGAWTKLWNSSKGFATDKLPDDDWNFQNWNGISIWLILKFNTQALVFKLRITAICNKWKGWPHFFGRPLCKGTNQKNFFLHLSSGSISFYNLHSVQSFEWKPRHIVSVRSPKRKLWHQRVSYPEVPNGRKQYWKVHYCLYSKRKQYRLFCFNFSTSYYQ